GHLVEPGIEAGTGRAAGRRLGIVAQEGRAIPCQGVEMRRPDARVSGIADDVAAPLVRCHEQDVGSAHRHWDGPQSQLVRTETMMSTATLTKMPARIVATAYTKTRSRGARISTGNPV